MAKTDVGVYVDSSGRMFSSSEGYASAKAYAEEWNAAHPSTPTPTVKATPVVYSAENMPKTYSAAVSSGLMKTSYSSTPSTTTPSPTISVVSSDNYFKPQTKTGGGTTPMIATPAKTTQTPTPTELTPVAGVPGVYYTGQISQPLKPTEKPLMQTLTTYPVAEPFLQAADIYHREVTTPFEQAYSKSWFKEGIIKSAGMAIVSLPEVVAFPGQLIMGGEIIARTPEKIPEYAVQTGSLLVESVKEHPVETIVQLAALHSIGKTMTPSKTTTLPDISKISSDLGKSKGGGGITPSPSGGGTGGVGSLTGEPSYQISTIYSKTKPTPVEVKGIISTPTTTKFTPIEFKETITDTSKYGSRFTPVEFKETIVSTPTQTITPTYSVEKSGQYVPTYDLTKVEIPSSGDIYSSGIKETIKPSENIPFTQITFTSPTKEAILYEKKQIEFVRKELEVERKTAIQEKIKEQTKKEQESGLEPYNIKMKNLFKEVYGTETPTKAQEYKIYEDMIKNPEMVGYSSIETSTTTGPKFKVFGKMFDIESGSVGMPQLMLEKKIETSRVKTIYKEPPLKDVELRIEPEVKTFDLTELNKLAKKTETKQYGISKFKSEYETKGIKTIDLTDLNKKSRITPTTFKPIVVTEKTTGTRFKPIVTTEIEPIVSTKLIRQQETKVTPITSVIPRTETITKLTTEQKTYTFPKTMTTTSLIPRVETMTKVYTIPKVITTTSLVPRTELVTKVTPVTATSLAVPLPIKLVKDIPSGGGFGDMSMKRGTRFTEISKYGIGGIGKQLNIKENNIFRKKGRK